MMRAWERTLRLLLIVGLIPAIVAAGVPVPACACDVASVADVCPCCQSDAASSCGAADSGRSCCRSEDDRSCCDKQDEPNAEPTLNCHCGGTVPAPAAPSPSTVEFPANAGLLADSFAMIPFPPAVPRSSEGMRSALLPSADLPTTLCTLLI